jgi:pimeloyl-ACP methyl ester carboxylesterase
MTQFHITKSGRKIAFAQRSRAPTGGIVFLGGFRSDMTGTKAAYLDDWAAQNRQNFLRFDYSGHGQSSGDFLDGSIGDWFADALDIITARTVGPQVLIGSSMGGWIALLLARAIPDQIKALLTIAAAPDFTEDSMWQGFSDTQKSALRDKGQIAVPSDYSDTPYIITQKLIDDGRRHLVLRSPLSLPFPTHFLQGTDDTDVTPDVALRLFDHAMGDRVKLTLIKGADHRFSTPECLAAITRAVQELS